MSAQTTEQINRSTAILKIAEYLARATDQQLEEILDTIYRESLVHYEIREDFQP